MPFHWCADETLMVLSMIPFIGLFFNRIHMWYHIKFKKKKCCNEERCSMPESLAHILHGKAGEGQCKEHPLENVNEKDSAGSHR